MVEPVTKEGLLACPMCGGKAENFSYSTMYSRIAGVRCKSCALKIQRESCDALDVDEIRGLWNRRAAHEPSEGPFVVADGGVTGENRFRTMKDGMSAWTIDFDEALQFARRKDAEAFAAEDEDAWQIIPVPWEKDLRARLTKSEVTAEETRAYDEDELSASEMANRGAEKDLDGYSSAFTARDELKAQEEAAERSRVEARQQRRKQVMAARPSQKTSALRCNAFIAPDEYCERQNGHTGKCGLEPI